MHVLFDEGVVEPASLFQFDRQRPGEDHVGAGADREVQVRVLGDLDPLGIDDDEFRAIALGDVDVAHQVQVAGRGVVAPDDDELRKVDLLQRRAGRRAEGAGIGLAAHAAAQRAAAEQRRPNPVEEAQRHRIACEHPVRAGVIERQHRLRAMAVKITSPTRSWMIPSASSQEMRSNLPSPLAPTRFIG